MVSNPKVFPLKKLVKTDAVFIKFIVVFPSMFCYTEFIRQRKSTVNDCQSISQRDVGFSGEASRRVCKSGLTFAATGHLILKQRLTDTL